MRIVLGLLLALGLVLPLPAQAAEPLVEAMPARSKFSPNGDGVKDTLPVPFRLAERARVTVRVPHVGTYRLGVRGPGAHRWRWDGRGAPSGGHRLVVIARTGDGRTGEDVRWGVIDRGEGLDRVSLSLTRRTVHPETPGKHDLIHVHNSSYGNPTGVTLVDSSGTVVLEDEFRQWWTWDGSGLPPGEYAATFVLSDAYGNRREIPRTLTISSEPLVQETWTTTVDAADVELQRNSCGTSPSARFDGGLTVSPVPGCDRAGLLPLFALPVDADPDVTWRLTVTGGPTVPGADDTALVCISDDLDVVATRTATGDTTTTTPWGRPNDYEWDPEREPELTGWVIVD